MNKLIEVSVILTKEEKELLDFKYQHDMKIRDALYRLLNKAVSKECDQIESSDEWVYRNSTVETTEKDAI